MRKYKTFYRSDPFRFTLLTFSPMAFKWGLESSDHRGFSPEISGNLNDEKALESFLVHSSPGPSIQATSCVCAFCNYLSILADPICAQQNPRIV